MAYPGAGYPEAFTAQERSQPDFAQAVMLKQLYDDLDEVVAKAYRWPIDIVDAGILERMVSLNR